MTLQHSKCLQHCDVIVGVDSFASLVEDALEEGEAEAEGRCEEGGGSRVGVELFDGAFRLDGQRFCCPFSLEHARRLHQTNAAVRHQIG